MKTDPLHLCPSFQFLPRPVRFRRVPGKVLLTCLLSLSRAPLWAQEGKFTADFEAPSYQPGSIHGQQGWSVEQGVARVTAAAGRNASAGLVLEPASPFSQATLLLDAPLAGGSPGFLDFQVAPAATDEVRSEEMLDIDSARIGFFRTAAQPAQGRFWIFHGNGAGGGVWQATPVVLPVEAATGRPAGWVRLTLREDFAAQSWDFWVNGQLAASAAGFQEPAGDHTGSYVILGDAVERLVLDDLTIGGPNPLGLDADADGMLDADEARIGSDPAVADRAGVDAAGVTFGEKWKNLLRSDASAAASLPPPVFSRTSAVMAETFNLSLSSTEGTTVYYTLDGSNPLPATAAAYTIPLVINSTTVVRACAADTQGQVSATTAAAWVFPSQVPAQTLPSGWPETLSEADPVTGGVRLFPLSPRMSAAPHTGVGELAADSVAAALSKAPIVVLTSDPDDLFGTHGVYRNAADSAGRKTSGEIVWMDEATGGSGGAAGAMISVSGQESRSHLVTLKHSLRVAWPTTEDAGTVFGEASFPCRQLLLRHPTHDSWVVDGAWSGRRAGARYITDAWASSWLEQQGHPSLKHHWVHVFLNGIYWGVYDAVEQHDAEYARRHQPGSAVHLVEPDPANSWSGVRAVTGSASGWTDELLRLRGITNSGKAMTKQEWESAAAPFNTSALIDYILWNWWLANGDWPVRNWLAAFESGQWTPLSWDAEMAIPLDRDQLPLMAERLEMDAAGPAAVFMLLCEWPGFRERVISRLSALTEEAGALGIPEIKKSWERAAAGFHDLAVAESSRWGGQYQLPFLTRDDWENAIARVTRKFLPTRNSQVVSEVRDLMLEIAGRVDRKHHPVPDPEVFTGPIQLAPSVAVPTDSDGDRMPDEWERSHGLNPDDPSDAWLDKDRDGVANLDEYLRRTDPSKADAPGPVAEEGASVHTRFPIKQRRRIVPAAR